MTILTPKPSADARLYTLDVADLVGDDPISTFTLVRTAGTVVIGTLSNTATAIRSLLSGGVNGETATFALQVKTDAGQIINRTYSLLVADAGTGFVSTTTKRTLISMAFEEMTLAGYEFDATPEEWSSAMRRLDALMAEWAQTGLDLGYNFPASLGTGDLNDVSNIPDSTVNTVIIQLALRCAPAIGKTMSTESKFALTQGMIALRTAYAVIPSTPLPDGTIRGAGNRRPFGSPFILGDAAS